MDSIFLVSARGSSSGSPEANQIIRGRHFTASFSFTGVGAGGYTQPLYGVVNGANIPKISKEFL